jgi:hypothetical protein
MRRRCSRPRRPAMRPRRRRRRHDAPTAPTGGISSDGARTRAHPLPASAATVAAYLAQLEHSPPLWGHATEWFEFVARLRAFEQLHGARARLTGLVADPALRFGPRRSTGKGRAHWRRVPGRPARPSGHLGRPPRNRDGGEDIGAAAGLSRRPGFRGCAGVDASKSLIRNGVSIPIQMKGGAASVSSPS